MNYFLRRRLRNISKQLRHEARHARNMREDVADAESLGRLAASEGALGAAWGGGEASAIEKALDEFADAIAAVYPQRPLAKYRETVEIVAVALAVAMGFRTYFLQPFKIPTASMQPTLYGITVEPRSGPGASDRFPLNILKLAVMGRRYQQVRAKAGGEVDQYWQYLREEDSFLVFINRIPHKIHRNMQRHFELGQKVTKGHVLATGERIFGDHIFVDRVRYNFARPKRGQIVVFDTTHVDHPQVRENSFYIKRLTGLPNESISIDPPYLVVDGRRVTEAPFKRLLEDSAHGYGGYELARPDQGSTPPLLQRPQDAIHLKDGEYLPMGDNTAHSLDGRYFGPVTQRDLVGPALAVYWPFSGRWGRVK